MKLNFLKVFVFCKKYWIGIVGTLNIPAAILFANSGKMVFAWGFATLAIAGLVNQLLILKFPHDHQ